MIKRFMQVLAILSVAPFCFAEDIILKSGKTIEGKIIEKTDEYVKVDFKGVPLTYFFDDIESIKGSGIDTASMQQNVVGQSGGMSKSSSQYNDQASGLTITPPQGWREMATQGELKRLLGVSWSKSGSNDIPYLSLQVGAVPPGVNTAKDFAEGLLTRYRQSEPTTVIEEPHELVINNLKLFKMTTDVFEPGYPSALRTATYVYVAGDRAVRIMISDESKRFAETEAETAGALNSIKIADKVDSYVMPNPRAYQNIRPSFEISIPENLDNWEIRTRNIKEKPIIFFRVESKSLPFIDTYIDFYDVLFDNTKEAWSDDKILELKAFNDKKFEKEVLPDVEFISDKKITLAGLTAFDRVYRSQKSGVTYHSVYVLLPEGIVTFGLNAFTSSFDSDNEEFASIISTLKKL